MRQDLLIVRIQERQHADDSVSEILTCEKAREIYGGGQQGTTSPSDKLPLYASKG